MTSHFGMKPTRGGIPPRERKFNMIRGDKLVCICAEALKFLVEDFCVRKMGTMTEMVTRQYIEK